LQPQVDQLAEMLSLELSTKRDYVQMLLEAHRTMSEISEQMAGEPHSETIPDRSHTQLWAQTCELSDAMHKFLEGEIHAPKANSRGVQRAAAHAAHRLPGITSVDIDPAAWKGSSSPLLRALFAAAKRCRERRGELSLVLIEPSADAAQLELEQKRACSQIQLAVIQACASMDQENVMLMLVGGGRIAAILSECERRAAVAVAQDAIFACGRPASMSGGIATEMTATVSVGVATAGVVPRNFDPQRLLECAERCLSAARTCGISTVKSIEV
jgi:hypothetical protein